MEAWSDVLREECLAGLGKIYGDEPGELRLRRLEHELKLIEERALCCAFHEIGDLVRHIKQPNSPLIGPERGASAGSLVCRALGITGLDPLEHGLLVERLLAPAGNALIIGIDVPRNRRHQDRGPDTA